MHTKRKMNAYKFKFVCIHFYISSHSKFSIFCDELLFVYFNSVFPMKVCVCFATIAQTKRSYSRLPLLKERVCFVAIVHTKRSYSRLPLLKERVCFVAIVHTEGTYFRLLLLKERVFFVAIVHIKRTYSRLSFLEVCVRSTSISCI